VYIHVLNIYISLIKLRLGIILKLQSDQK